MMKLKTEKDCENKYYTNIIFEQKTYELNLRNKVWNKTTTISEACLVHCMRLEEGVYLRRTIKSDRIFKSKKHNIRWDFGIPDFYYRQKGKITFVESKSGPDGLRFSQLKWIHDHPEYVVRIIFIKINDKR